MAAGAKQGGAKQGTPALLAKFRRAWKTLAGTNTLAYFAQVSVTKKKDFIKCRLGENCEHWPAKGKKWV